jgi:hypothetical protein
MTEDEARDKLTLMVLADEDPALSEAQLEDVLMHARLPDADGNVYGDDAWTPTWDLTGAAAEGWRRKAGIAASRFNFAEDGQRFDRAQVYAHCISQANYYAEKAMGSIPISSSS